MSIAQAQKIKDLEAEVKTLAELTNAAYESARASRIALDSLNERLTALENRPKPGRPPKNG